MTTNKNSRSKVCVTVSATTPQRNNRYSVTIAILLIVAQIATGSGCACGLCRTKKARWQAAERKIEVLAKKHGANTNWVDAFKSDSKGLDVFSFHRQEAFDPLIGIRFSQWSRSSMSSGPRMATA